MTTAFLPSVAAVPSSSFVPCTQQSAKVSSVFAKPTKVSSRFAVSASAPSLLHGSFAGLSLQEKSFFGASVAQQPEIVEDAADFSIECMRHGNKLKKLNKPADQRKALLRALTTEVLRHGAIKCPLVRAKVLRAHVDHIITLAKDGSLHARRQAMGWVYDKRLVSAVFEKAPKRYAERNGGYTRVLRTLPRRGDNAPMGIIELV